MKNAKCNTILLDICKIVKWLLIFKEIPNVYRALSFFFILVTNRLTFSIIKLILNVCNDAQFYPRFSISKMIPDPELTP